MNSILKELIEAYSFTENEAEDAIDFVAELMEEQRDYTERNEPYATNTIERNELAIREVHNLRDLF